jgi:hypothetical protein
MLILFLFATRNYAQKPEFVFPVGQTSPVETTKFSRYGKFVLTMKINLTTALILPDLKIILLRFGMP